MSGSPDLPSPPRNVPLPAVAAAATAAAATTTAAASTAAAASAAATTATAVEAPTAAAVATTAAAAAAGLTFVGFVHADGAAVKLGTIHLSHRGGRRCVVGKRNESESAGPTRLSVRDDLGIVELTKALECDTETLVVRTPAKTTYEQPLGHLSL